MTLALTALLGAAALWRFGSTWALPAYLVLAAVTAPIVMLDLRERRVANAFPAAALPAVVALLALACLVDGTWTRLAQAAAIGLAVFAAYLALHAISPRGLGAGDVKLAAPVGVLLGWVSWPAALGATLLAFGGAALVAAAGAVCGAVSGRGHRGSTIAFAPCLLGGAWLALLATAPVEAAALWLVTDR